MDVWQFYCGACSDAASGSVQGKKGACMSRYCNVMCESGGDARSMRLFNTIEDGQLLVGTWPSSCCGHGSVCRREARCANVHERVTRGVTPWKRLQGPSIAAPRRRVKGACRRRVCNASFAQLHV